MKQGTQSIQLSNKPTEKTDTAERKIPNQKYKIASVYKTMFQGKK